MTDRAAGDSEERHDTARQADRNTRSGRRTRTDKHARHQRHEASNGAVAANFTRRRIYIAPSSDKQGGAKSETRTRPPREPHETETGEASRPTTGARNDGARRDGGTSRAKQREGETQNQARGEKADADGENQSTAPMEWHDPTVSPRRCQAGKQGRRDDRTGWMRRGRKQGRSKERTGRGTRGEWGTGPMADNETRPSKQREKRGTRGKPEPQAGRKRTSASGERRHDTDEKQANRSPVRASPDPAGGGLNEASKQERTRNEGVGRRRKKGKRRTWQLDETKQ